MSHDVHVRDLVDDFRKGYLTRRGFLAKAGALGLTAAAAIGVLAAPRTQKSAVAQDSPQVEPKQWQKGKGWGWVWGPQDEVGALNEMTDASRLAAMQLVK